MKGSDGLRWGSGCLANSPAYAGQPGSECDRAAMLLLMGATGLEGTAFYTALSQCLPEGKWSDYRELVNRAANGEPVQYILGRWDFYGSTFLTDRRALIPRPETERLVETALAQLPGGGAPDVIDVGCGSGCIGIAIKLKRPAARVTLCDVDNGALALSGENAQRLRADVAILLADMRLPLPGGPYDAIVSNPPYINARDMETLPDVVRRHEPALALFGGEDGLDFIRALAQRAGDSLKPGGWLIVEVGYDQADQAMGLMRSAGLPASAIADYSGIQRVIAARKGL